jgi:hypothetical protein
MTVPWPGVFRIRPSRMLVYRHAAGTTSRHFTKPAVSIKYFAGTPRMTVFRAEDLKRRPRFSRIRYQCRASRGRNECSARAPDRSGLSLVRRDPKKDSFGSFGDRAVNQLSSYLNCPSFRLNDRPCPGDFLFGWGERRPDRA